jgi:hypothetical protein
MTDDACGAVVKFDEIARVKRQRPLALSVAVSA